ncbi:YfcC family protein [Candidatus Pseudothioglobus singularis]|nr:YfcC family protein [Candidatus Pseudothioglobus singularis]
MEAQNQPKKSRMPHIYVILISLIALGALMTYIIPAGKYERVTNEEGMEVVQPDSFQFIEQTPVGLFDFMLAIPNGFIETAELVFGIIMIGGMFAVIEKTGIISLAVEKLAKTFSNRGVWVIPILMIPFALITTFTNLIELSLVYLPAIMPLILRLGFDRITAAGTVLVATCVGFTVGLTSPANVGVAQTVSQLPLYSGMGYRAIILSIMLTIGIVFVCRYARKVQANPELSLTQHDLADPVDTQEINNIKATKKQIAAAFVILIAFAILIYGLIVHQWYFRELAGLYILTGIAVGLVAGLRPSEIAEAFNEGFKSILLGAFVVGVARGISVVLNEGNIMDTIIYAGGTLVESMPSSITAVIMFIVQAMINFVIPSGSGQAMVTMPIMAGIADLTGVTRQTAVLAFLFGDGFANILYPTSGYFMATLAIARIGWEKWVKFIWPLLAIWYALSVVFLIIAQLINYS